jgi:type II secretory pathway component PulK
MRTRRGFALMAALWLLVAISAVSLELSVIARDRRLWAANTLEDARAGLAAASAVEHARARLVRAIAEGGVGRTWNDVRAVMDPWHDLDLGIPDSVSIGSGVWYRARVEALGARMNVNRSSQEDLRRYFTGLGIDVIQVEAAVDGIMDWRDVDEHRRNRGAERADYLKAGARELPANRDFASLAELLDVRGLTPELMDHVKRDFTVFGSGQIEINTAPASVLGSLPGFTPLAIEIVVNARRSGRRIESVQQLSGMMPSAARSPLQASLPLLLSKITFDTHEALVTGEGWLTGSPVRVLEVAVVARGGDAAFVTWRQRQ